MYGTAGKVAFGLITPFGKNTQHKGALYNDHKNMSPKCVEQKKHCDSNLLRHLPVEICQGRLLSERGVFALSLSLHANNDTHEK